MLEDHDALIWNPWSVACIHPVYTFSWTVAFAVRWCRQLHHSTFGMAPLVSTKCLSYNRHVIIMRFGTSLTIIRLAKDLIHVLNSSCCPYYPFLFFFSLSSVQKMKMIDTLHGKLWREKKLVASMDQGFLTLKTAKPYHKLFVVFILSTHCTIFDFVYHIFYNFLISWMPCLE